MLSEVIRKFSQFGNLLFNPLEIIGFKTDSIHLNYHLSCLYWTLPDLKGKFLRPIFKANLDETVSLFWFEILRKTGAGGFSVVYLVRSLINGSFYAMKEIDKALMLDRDNEEIVFNERSIMSKVNHPRLIALHYAF